MSIQRDMRPVEVQLRENVIGFKADKLPFVYDPDRSAPILARLMPAEEQPVVRLAANEPRRANRKVKEDFAAQVDPVATDQEIILTEEKFEYAEYERFCRENPAECESATPERVTMTPELLSRLNSLNLTVNVNYKYKLDQENYNVPDRWTLPGDSSMWTGDCEDWALFKRKMLKDVVPAGAMTMAYVSFKDPKITTDHAVLVIRSDRGDYMLDINDGRVVLVKDSPYVVKAITDVSDRNAMKVAYLPTPAESVQLASGLSSAQPASP